MTDAFLDLLAAGSPLAAFDEVVNDAVAAGLPEDQLEALRGRRVLALRLREQMERQRQREAELSALYDTAGDLTAIRDVDAILSAIVRRARQLLHADMTYLSLNDEHEGASYMRVTDGALTAAFRTLRLPLGTGLLGLVAQSGAPYFTEDYRTDDRFVHREYIDEAVEGEQIRAILGVPLIVEGKVIGALLAVHRTVRKFPPGEVSLLTSFAAHAAVALENARLFEQTQAALAERDDANRQIRAQVDAVERAARAHDRLTDALVTGGGVQDVAAVLADVLRGSLTVYDAGLRVLATTDAGELAGGLPGGLAGGLAGGPAGGLAGGLAGLDEAIAAARGSGRSVELRTPGGPSYAAAALAGAEHLGTLVLAVSDPLDQAERRTLERGALVTALVLLFQRSGAEAEERVRGELLVDLLEGGDADTARLLERARRQQAHLAEPTAVAVASIDGLEKHRAAQLAARMAGELHGLAGEYDGRIVLVAPSREPLAVARQLGDRLRSAGGTPTVGVTSAPNVGGLSDAHAEAARCLKTLLTLGRSGEVSDPAGLGLARLLLGQNGPEELAAFVEGTLGPVLAYDTRRGTALVATLDAWFASGGRPAEAAKRLHVHPNTVAQRLDRVGTLLGDDWRDPTRSLDLQLALRLHRLRARP